MFPSEDRRSFYIPGCDKAAARGKLYQAYKGYRTKLAAAGLISLRAKKKRLSAKAESYPQPDQVDIVSLMEFLHSHTDPWSQIVVNWKETWIARSALMQDKTKSIEEYIQTFPCLSMANGFELVSKF